MTDGRAPWWYSGDDDETTAAPTESDQSSADGTSAESEGEPSTLDWMSLLAGAARMVDWATTTVMAPHAEHDDPAEHPTCVVCRTITLVGDPVGLMAPRGATEPTQERAAAPSIAWIPIRDESVEP